MFPTRKPRRSHPGGSPRRRLGLLELLEDRSVPAVLTFSAGNGADLGATINDGQFSSPDVAGLSLEIYSVDQFGNARGSNIHFTTAGGGGGGLIGAGPGTPYKSLVIQTTDGTNFNFSGFAAAELSGSFGGGILVQGFDNGVATGDGNSVGLSITSSSTATYTSADFPAQKFGSVDRVVIIVDDGYTGMAQIQLNNFDINPLAPSVSSVSLDASLNPNSALYHQGDFIDLTASFSQPVTANTSGGTPTLSFTLGGALRTATYVSGSTTTDLVFRYTVQAGDSGAIAVPDGSISLNSATIEGGGNAAALAFSNVSVSGSVDTTVPVAGMVTANGVTTAGGTTYSFTVQYSDANGIDASSLGTADVTVTGPNGFTSTISGFSSIGGTVAYSFTAPGGAWDPTDNGVYTIAINAGQVFDIAGNPVAADLTAATFTVTVPELTGSVTAGSGVAEPVTLPTTADSLGEAVAVFDFTISDTGTSDGLSLDVTQIKVSTGGTGDFSKVVWLLDGPGVSSVTGVYNAGTNTITFAGLSISVADGASATYTVRAYYDTSGGLSVIDGATYLLSVDGDDPGAFTVSPTGTQMAGSQAAVSNGAGTTVNVAGTQLRYSSAPGTSVSGAALGAQPVVEAVDAFGNVDTNFVGNVTLTEASAGTLSGTVTVAASAGVATFTGVVYTATVDQQNFLLTASSTGLTGATSGTITSDVVATRLVFSTPAMPTALVSGLSTVFTTVPVVTAVDAAGIVDVDYGTAFVLSVTDPSDGTVDGTINALTGSGDGDGAGTTVTLTPSGGVATFAGLSITYTNSGNPNTIALRAASGALTAATSAAITSALPTVSISDVTEAEGDDGSRSFTFTLTLSAPSSQEVTVDFVTADGTAVAGSDYASRSGTVTFAPGVLTQTIVVVVNGDREVESTETFRVVLSNAVAATIAKGTGTGAITNDDVFPKTEVVVSVSNSSAGGVVQLFDPTTGKPTGQIQAYTGFSGEIRLSSADFNGDGVADKVTGAGAGAMGGHIKVFDGATGQELMSFFAFDGFSGGVFVASGDVNGDGINDVVVAADAGAAPHVKVFSGKDGSELMSFIAYDMAFRGGVRVAVADVDGDGRADIVTGSGAGAPAHVKVFSGRDGALLASFMPYDSFAGGVYVGAGDLDGDGRAEIVTGAGAGAPPHVRVFSGADLSILGSFFAFEQAFRGGVRVGVQAINGVPVMILGAGPGAGPHVRALNITSQDDLFSLFVGGPDDSGGVYVS